MCTSILYSPKDHYFGRNLDYEVAYGQKVVVVPRSYVLKYRDLPEDTFHYAMIGVSVIANDYPLLCDGINEKGLGAAGLNFARIGRYFPKITDKKNITSFELISYLLANFETVDQVKADLANASILNESFSSDLPAGSLHWLVGDKTGKSIVIESTESGLHAYDNPVNTLTNDPEFPAQLNKLSDYADVNPAQPQNTLIPNLDLTYYSRGMGTHHLPGGMDSSGRFVKAAFALAHAPKGKSEVENVTNYFHILQSVEQAKGLDEVEPNKFEFTMYSDCMNLDQGILYFTTYDDNRITGIDMHKEDLDSDQLITYDLFRKQDIDFAN